MISDSAAGGLVAAAGLFVLHARHRIMRALLFGFWAVTRQNLSPELIVKYADRWRRLVKLLAVVFSPVLIAFVAALTKDGGLIVQAFAWAWVAVSILVGLVIVQLFAKCNADRTAEACGRFPSDDDPMYGQLRFAGDSLSIGIKLGACLVFLSPAVAAYLVMGGLATYLVIDRPLARHQPPERLSVSRILRLVAAAMTTVLVALALLLSVFLMSECSGSPHQ